MEVFKRITSVNTPSINSRLALPFKKWPVKDSTKFKKEYAEIKDDLRKITGGLGKENYKEQREKRKSLQFPWPLASPENTVKLTSDADCTTEVCILGYLQYPDGWAPAKPTGSAVQERVYATSSWSHIAR